MWDVSVCLDVDLYHACLIRWIDVVYRVEYDREHHDIADNFHLYHQKPCRSTTENVVGLLPVHQGLVQTYKFGNL
jgi:hypothetical protein